MALFNESLAGRLNEAISRLHGTKGHPPAPQISPEIQHVIQIEPPGAEHRPLAGWRYFFWSVALAASANIGVVTITNPASSGVLAVLERVKVFCAGTALRSLLDIRGNATQVGGSPGYSRDSRIISGGIRGISACLIQATDNVTAGADLQFYPMDFALGLISIFEPVKGGVDEWVITANDGWGVQKQAANNESLQVAFWWRERAILESEIRL